MAPHDDSNSSIESAASELITCDSISMLKEADDHMIGTLDEVAAGHSLTACRSELPSSTASIDPPASPLNSILRQSRYSKVQEKEQQGPIDAPSTDEDDDLHRSHWPTLRRVHFIDDHSTESVVTGTIYRDYTEYAEVSNYYYTAADFDQFKREYRSLLKAQRRRKQGMQVSADEAKNNGGLIKNSSFWRSKAHGRFYDPSNGTFSQPEKEQISTSSNAGVFSSVFDVAKEAVSLFSGSSNYSYYQNQASPHSKARQQQQLLVDTLYSNLF